MKSQTSAVKYLSCGDMNGGAVRFRLRLPFWLMTALFLLVFSGRPAKSQLLAGFKPSGLFGELQMVIEDSPPDTRILINAPLQGFGKDYLSGSFRLNIPPRDPAAETGSEFMNRISELPLEEREEEIFRAAASGNVPDFLRKTVTLRGVFNDLNGMPHTLEYEVMPDYLAIGSDDEFCRIPMNPRTAQRLADLFGASLLTAKLSDDIWSHAEVKLDPFFYRPVGNANELVTKFEVHNAQIEKQLDEAGGLHGHLVAGIKKDVIISSRLSEHTDRVVIYGWHRPDGSHIQPVYSGHVWWYVDYSHGIRFMNRQVLLDGHAADVREILKDPVLFRVLSNEDQPMEMPFYPVEQAPDRN